MIEKQIEIQQGRFLVRPYRKDDQSGVLSLWKAAFGKELSPRLFQWKYLENPYTVQIALAVDEDARILVMYGGIPYRVNWKGNPVNMTHLMDIMSHPDCRKSGLFVKTGMAFFDLFAGPDRTCFYYGFPGKYHFDIGEKYLAYTGLDGGVRFLSAPTGALVLKSRALSGRIERVRDVDETFDDLWGGCREHYPFAVIRNAAFLRWRFFKHPSRKYEVWTYKSYFKKNLNAYAVFALEGETARMVDILAPSAEKKVEDFLARVSHQFHRRGIKAIETWLPGSHFLIQSLVTAGFGERQEPLGFIPTGRSFHPDISVDWASRNLFYTMADGDLL